MATIENAGRFSPPGMARRRRRDFEPGQLDPDDSVASEELEEGIDEAARDRREAEERDEAAREERERSRPGKREGGGKAGNGDSYCPECEGDHVPDSLHPGPDVRISGGTVLGSEESWRSLQEQRDAARRAEAARLEEARQLREAKIAEQRRQQALYVGPDLPLELKAPERMQSDQEDEYLVERRPERETRDEDDSELLELESAISTSPGAVGLAREPLARTIVEGSEATPYVLQSASNPTPASSNDAAELAAIASIEDRNERIRLDTRVSG